METKLKVDGMSCMHCAGRVKKAIEQINGTENINVDLQKKEAVFTGNIDEKALDSLIFNIKALGFQASRME